MSEVVANPGTNLQLTSDSWLDELVAMYHESRETGNVPNTSEWLCRHPELATELTQFLADTEVIDRLTAPLRTVASPPQRSFGNYELLQEVGRGGMGIVYKARQKTPNRLVALKLIRTGSQATSTEIQRFRNEAEAAAHLDHPFIVPVYDVGETEGQLYFTLRLIEGGSLAHHLVERSFDPPEAAKLTAAIGHAVHHAHQRGILHRDLKPSNILLDGDGQPHVTDFGLAKWLTGDTAMTCTGEFVGSPAYMAPETAQGKRHAVTTATDVYGLGVILYVLLTRRLPFEASTALELLEQVKHQAPTPLGQINRQVDRDLETICLKCLEKEPERRYRSAEALADDLQRWLDGKPILARPVNRMERLTRWCRRNPILGAMTGIAALCVVALAISTVVIWREKEQTKNALAQAREERTAALEQRRRAEANSRKAISGMDHLWAAFEKTDWGREPRLEEVRRAMSNKALSFFGGFLAEDDLDPGSRWELGLALVHIGTFHASHQDGPAGAQALQQAVAIFDRLAADYPGDPDYAVEAAAARIPLAELLREIGQPERAADEYRQARDIFRRQCAAHPEYHRPVSHYATLLATCRDPQFRDPELAVKLTRQVIEMAPGRTTYWIDLGIACYRAGQWRESIAAMLKSVELHAGGDFHEWFFLAMSHWQLGEKEEALRWFDKGRKMMNENKQVDAPDYFEAKLLLFGEKDIRPAK